MSIKDHSEDDLALLTDEERAGLAEDGADDGDGDEGADDGDDDSGDDDGDGADDNASAEDADEGDDANAGDGQEGRDDGATEDDDDDGDDDAARPQPSGERVNVGETQSRLDAITTEKTELMEKLDDGEITTKEFTAAVDKLNDEKNQLSNALARQQDADNAVTTAWYKDVEKFLAKNPDISANKTRLQSFDTVVREITADPANAQLSNRKQLELARTTWRAEMGIAEPANAAKEGEAPKPAPKPAKPKPALPPTLHNVPAADVNDAADGKYSYLDALLNAGKTIEYEDALAKLSDADQDDYLSRA